ncbi:hypothetical protein V6N12_002880 [Hibiscus sabdariffa]|uniref:Uncharacterized protein n=1 Tax=Hibiscus sabdariffa TaxID=183260 RepID=A0ABR2ECD8_9ROSI
MWNYDEDDEIYPQEHVDAGHLPGTMMGFHHQRNYKVALRLVPEKPVEEELEIPYDCEDPKRMCFFLGGPWKYAVISFTTEFGFLQSLLLSSSGTHSSIPRIYGHSRSEQPLHLAL